MDEDVFLPVQALNALRREALRTGGEASAGIPQGWGSVPGGGEVRAVARTKGRGRRSEEKQRMPVKRSSFRWRTASAVGGASFFLCT